MKAKLSKIQKMSVAELRVRGSQALAALAERHGWSSQSKLPSDGTLLRLLDSSQSGLDEPNSAEKFLDHFKNRREPRFFAPFEQKEKTIAEFRRRWPAAETDTIREAEQICTGRFDLLGLRDLSFGDPIDWHLEPLAGKRAPVLHWSRLDYLDAEIAGDKKIIWELNRHQYFVTLGQAYWLSGDERYSRVFIEHITSWMNQNPPKLGINWASSLEVAFRSISWLWGLYFFRDSPILTAAVFLRAMKFLYLSARHLETYLSTYFSPNTHLTGEALGLFYLGTLLPEFRESARWRDKGFRILMTQLTRHVRSDGVYFEQSSYYHRYTTDFYTHLLILLQENEAAVPPQLEEKLVLLLDHLMYITRPDGTTPLLGDDDGGRLLNLERCSSNDFRATLSTGAALFGRPDYKYVADGAYRETLWLLGAEGLRKLDSVLAEEPSHQSVAFAAGGYYVMRDGWTKSSNYLLFDCGPHGTDNCGHAHADALSFELAARGTTLLVDPGTFTYTGSKEMRQWFRGSSAHNTLTVDGESSSISAGPFSWSTTARSEAFSWISQNRFDYLDAGHYGYGRLTYPVMHRRSVLFLKNDYWIVRDNVTSSGDHLLDLWFHFDSGVAPLRASHEHVQVVTENDSTAGLQLATFAGGGTWRWEEGWVSHCYGERTAAPVHVFSTLAKGTTEIVTFLIPQISGQFPKPSVREIEAVGGHAFEIVCENNLDLVMVREAASLDDQRVEAARMVTDFEWSWTRFSSDRTEIPEEFVVIGGQILELHGQEVLRSAGRINHLAAIRSGGNQFRVETDEGILDLGLPI